MQKTTYKAVFRQQAISFPTGSYTTWEPRIEVYYMLFYIVYIISLVPGNCCIQAWTFFFHPMSRKPTFRLEPKQRITSAALAASAAPFQLSGCSRVPRSPKCTMVSLSSPPQWLHVRPVPWRCSDVLSVTSNNRTYSLSGEQDVHTWKGSSANQCHHDLSPR